MAKGGARAGRARVGGLIAAACVGALGVGVVAWFSVQGAGRPHGAFVPSELVDNSPPPDIKDSPRIEGSRGASGRIVQAHKFRMEMADPEDPARVASVLTAESAEPDEAHSYTLVKPLAQQFQRDGRTILVSADKGRAYIPNEERGGRPENATLENNARLEVYEPQAGAGPIDPAVDHPVLVGTTDRIDYNGTFGEVVAPGVIDITSAALSGKLAALTMRFNEAKQRVEYLRFDPTPGQFLSFNPAGQKHASPSESPAPNAAPTAAAPPPESPAPLPSALSADAASKPLSPPTNSAQPSQKRGRADETLYHIVLRDSIVVTQGTRRINADRLEIWMRLVGNRLPEGAIAESDSPPREAVVSLPGPAWSGVVAAAVADLDDTAAANTGTNTGANTGTNTGMDTNVKPRGLLKGRASADPVKVTWSGPAEVESISIAPPELAGNDVSLRFSASGDGAVLALDDESGATAEGAVLHYGATLQDLALAGSADKHARIRVPAVGEGEATRFTINLTTGLAGADGSGWVQQEADAGLRGTEADFFPSTPRRLQWSRGAEFALAVIDGTLTGRPLWAKPRGDVLARDTSGEIRGDTLAATFEPVAGAPDKTTIASLSVSGHANVTDGKGSTLSGDTIDAEFTPVAAKPGTSDPRRVTARGSVVGVREGSRIEAGRVEADLARDDRNTLAITHATAQDGVRFAAKDGVRAEGDRVEVEPARQSLVLAGPGGLVAQRGTTITGTRIELDGANRTIAVFSPGALRHDDRPTVDGARAAEMAVSWTKQMRFDDRTGEGECAGGVHAEMNRFDDASHPTLRTGRDTLAAERVRLELTPARGHEPRGAPENPDAGVVPSDPATPRADAGALREPRRLIRAQALGGTDDGASAGIMGVATLESRRYEPAPAGDPNLNRLVYLESGTIRLDNTTPDAGVVTAPGPGKLLLVDRRNAPPPSEAPAAAPIDRVARGDALFTWAGAMAMDQKSGEVRMNNAVELKHVQEDARPGKQGDVVTAMKCSELLARVRSAATKEGDGTLESAQADGDVWFSFDQRQMQADHLAYAAATGDVEARADDANIVTLFDTESGSPVTAAHLLWNLKSGRIEVKKPGTLVVPK